MKRVMIWLATMAAGGLALSAQETPVEQLKSDLIGHTMGGREKCWKFRSVEHIKQLVVNERTEDARKRVYLITLHLQATRSCGKYAAQARVEYAKAGTAWKLRQVGLLALERLE